MFYGYDTPSKHYCNNMNGHVTYDINLNCFKYIFWIAFSLLYFVYMKTIMNACNKVVNYKPFSPNMANPGIKYP